MTQEEKSILLEDLCARLPHNCRVFYEYIDDLDNKNYGYSLTLNTWCIDEMKAEKAIVKPFLRPMSSMSDDEEIEYESIKGWKNEWELVDWLNERHFDYRGLIPKGLALKAKEGMYKV